MNSLETHHLDDGLLLRYIDGELPARRNRQVTRHLEACWQCRSGVEELQTTIADCVRYRKNVLETHLPAPPEPWTDIYRAFDRIDLEMAEEPWIKRLLQSLTSPSTGRWAAAMAVAAVLLVVAYRQFHQAPSVEAAVLLERAVTASSARPAIPRRVLFQTRTQRMTRVVGNGRRAALAEPLAKSLEERFQQARYSWDDPLSAKSYQDWFGGLATRHEEVSTVADPQFPAERCYRIRTETPDGSLAAASLMLRTTDLRPVEGKLEFRDREWVEFSEITDATTRDDGRPAATNVEPPTRGAEPSRLPAAPGAPASVSDELQVLAALHEIGADLGDPLEVTLAGGRLMVNGVGIPAARQKQIRDHLEGLPHVEVQFSDPVSTPLPAEPPPSAAASGSGKPGGMQARVEQQVGGRAEFERFSSQVLDRNEQLMAHAYALRTLAQRFPADAEAGLSAQDRQVLRDMARENTARLSKEAAALERTLSPILTGMGGTTTPHAATSAASWEPAAEDLFRASRRVEVLVSVLLGAARGDTSTERLPSELLSAIRELREDVERCQQLLGQ